SLRETKAQSMILSSAIRKYPGITGVVPTVASSGAKKAHKAQLDIKLVDKAQRDFSQEVMMQQMRLELNEALAVNGATLSFAEDKSGRAQPIQFIFKSNNWEKLVSCSDEAALFCQNNIPDAVDVITTKPKPQREYKIKINTARAADLSITPAMVAA